MTTGNLKSLNREISKTNLLFISFAAIFGSGWLFAPFYAAQMAGPASLLAWFLGALMSAVIGITMAEVTTLFPKTGGLNVVAGKTHGELLSLFITSFNLLVFIILPALEVRAVLQYSASRFPFLAMENHELSALGYVFAFLLLSFVTLVNLYGSKVMTWATNVMVIFKVITPILVCVSFLFILYHSGKLDHSTLTHFFPIPWNQVFQAIATSGIIFSFNGFNQATIFAGEAKNPQKTIPFAILGSLAFSGALYILIQYCFLLAIPKENLAQGWAHLSFPGDQGPFAGIAVLLGLHWLLAIIYADAVISPLGTALTYASGAPRLFFTLGEHHKIFPGLTQLTRSGVPAIAILLTFALEIMIFILLPSLKAMIALLVAAFVLCYTVSPASLLVLRHTHPSVHRPFRIKSAPLACFLSLFFSLLMGFSSGWVALRNLTGVTIILIGIFIKMKWTEKETLTASLRSASWFILQLLGLLCLSYGEKEKMLTFPQVILGLIILSGMSIFLSLKSRLSYCTEA